MTTVTSPVQSLTTAITALEQGSKLIAARDYVASRAPIMQGAQALLVAGDQAATALPDPVRSRLSSAALEVAEGAGQLSAAIFSKRGAEVYAGEEAGLKFRSNEVTLTNAIQARLTGAVDTARLAIELLEGAAGAAA